MSVRIVSDWSEVYEELRRLERLPDTVGRGALETVLDTAFADTQMIVHVRTGSLKLSGKTSSSVHQHEWSGEITYGGTAPGAVFDPVRYAEYEQRRGGPHDFMANVHVVEDAFTEAVLQNLRGED